MPVPAPLRKVTLESLIAGATCSPIGLADFAGFLSFFEDSLSSLQFVVWYQSYRQRFNALPKSLQTLSPPDSHGLGRSLSRKIGHSASASSYEAGPGVDFVDGIPVHHPDPVAPFNSASAIPRSQQPFRNDVDRIIATFLDIDAPRNLPLPDDVRERVFHGLESTTHPDMLAPAYDVAYAVLRDALPRFLVQSTAVSAGPRRRFMLIRGTAMFSLGLLVFFAVLFGATEGPAHLNKKGARALRLLVLPFVFISMLDILFAVRGHCRITAAKGLAELQSWEVEKATGRSRAWWGDAAPDDLSEVEDGLAPVRSRGTVEMAASLSHRACQHAIRVKEQLLADLASLEFPTLRRGRPTPAQPVLISFTRATTVEVSDSAPRPSTHRISLDPEDGDTPKHSPGTTLDDDFAKMALEPALELSGPAKKRTIDRARRAVVRTKAVLDPRMLATHRRIEIFTLLSAVGIALMVTAVCVAIPVVQLQSGKWVIVQN